MTTFGSVCSGIEAASVAWHPLGWKASWLSEISKFQSQLLAHHYPEVQNLGDMMTIADLVKNGSVDAPDVFVGGTPCQAFSFAGLRNSLDDVRGNLTLEYARIADAIDDKRMESGRDPAVIVWENVPGILSTKDNAFGCFIGLLAGSGCELQPTGRRWSNAGCVYGQRRTVAWRILDAQYFGVAQRRRRVFIIASAGRVDPCEVLFEQRGLRGYIEAGENTWQSTTETTERRVDGDYRLSVFREGGFADYVPSEFGTLRSSGGACGHGSESLVVAPFDLQQITSKHNHSMVKCGAPSPTMTANSKIHAVAIQGNVIGRSDENGGNGLGCDENISPTLNSTDVHTVAFQSNASCKNNMPVLSELTPTIGAQNAGYMAMSDGYKVRRLTPKECERLQGFSDEYTNVPFGNRMASDTQRYRSIGNSMAVPVMIWIGSRIKACLEK
jgi:DNA (cytosine-5)-methyltransferase 1